MDATAIVVTVVNTGVLLALLAGVLALQVFLSRRKAWWPGLVLPACKLPGLLLILPNVLLNALSMADSVGQALAGVLGSALVLLPTVILTAIYLFCRRRHRQQKQIDKMNIQDL